VGRGGGVIYADIIFGKNKKKGEEKLGKMINRKEKGNIWV
jgi:hypothetical protein